MTEKPLMIISGHEVNSCNHPIEFNEGDRRVLMELYKSKSRVQNRA